MRLVKNIRFVCGIVLLAAGMAACTQPETETPEGTDTPNPPVGADTAYDQSATTGQQTSGNDEQEVRQAVEVFGERLKMVSVLAPDSILVRDVREQYGPLVTPELLAEWTANPNDAPGREVSSPWPERIEVTSLEKQPDGEYRVLGQVVYVTSAEQTSGGASSKENVVILVKQGDDGQWRLSRFEKTGSS
ncbi:MAG TPA: hypothetical protein VFG50_12495 [Rhodothermales bacterium]|nr:hypothetical protein [Rhodothermales bacterium]